MRSAGKVSPKPCPFPFRLTALLVPVEATSGVPSVQLKIAGRVLWLSAPPARLLKVEIWEPTLALWSKLLGVVRPQSAQSVVPSEVRLTREGGRIALPTRLPPVVVVVGVPVVEAVPVGVLVGVTVAVEVAGGGAVPAWA